MRARYLLAAGLILAACTAPAAAGTEYLLSEGVVDGPNRLTPTGASEIHVVNTGEFTHTLVVTDDQGQVRGATGLVQSGDEADLELELEPGTYVFSCRIVSEDGEGNLIDHYEAGMHRTVIVES